MGTGWCGCEVVVSGRSLAGLAREPPAASVGSARVCDPADGSNSRASSDGDRPSSRTNRTNSALYSGGYGARVRPPMIDSPLDPPRIPGSGCQRNRVSSTPPSSAVWHGRVMSMAEASDSAVGLCDPRHAPNERCIGSVYRVCRSLIDSTAALLGLPSAARPTTSLRWLRRHRLGWCQCP